MGQHSYSALLQYDADGVAPYTSVSEVISISGPEIETTDVEVTHLNSTSAFKEYVAGMRDGGEVEAECNFTKAQLNTFYSTIARTTYYWRILFPLISGESNNSRWDFQGHINNLGTEIPEDDRIMMKVKIKLTGVPTWTSGT